MSSSSIHTLDDFVPQVPCNNRHVLHDEQGLRNRRRGGLLCRLLYGGWSQGQGTADARGACGAACDESPGARCVGEKCGVWDKCGVWGRWCEGQGAADARGLGELLVPKALAGSRCE